MAYTYEAHRPVYNKHVRRIVCDRCGLVYLTNYLTRWHISMGCDAGSHPDVDRMCAELTEKWQRRHRKDD